MKRLTIILLALVMAFALAGPAQAEWVYSDYDAAGVVGHVNLCAPGIHAFQFVPDSLMVLPGDTDLTLYVYGETGSTAVASSVRSAEATTIAVTNATNTDWATAGRAIYSVKDNTDPNDATLLFFGIVASTDASASRGNEVITVAGGAEAVVKGVTIKKMAVISGNIMFGTEVSGDPVIFAEDGVNYTTTTTWYGIGSTFVPVDFLPPGDMGDDVCYVPLNPSGSTTDSGLLRGHYVKFKTLATGE